MSNGVILSEIFVDQVDKKIVHRASQPSEDLILARNERIRKEKPLKDLTFGRQVATIPFITLQIAERNGYDLNCPDGEIAQKEMMRFLKSPEGQVCLVVEKL